MKSKKIISFVLSLILMLSVFPQGILASDKSTEVKNNSMEELLADPGLTALSVVGVFDRNEAISNSSKPMTRKEFAKLAVKLMALDNALEASNGKRYFYDVSANDEYAPYIYTAASQGIIKPKQTNYFSPDAYVTKVDVANALINILGYTLQLELNGASEQNIVAIAAKYGILDNITDGTFTAFDVYTMIKDALEVPVLEISSIGESVSFTKNKDLGILAIYHDIYEEYGVVTANSNTGLKRISDNTEAGFVKIGNEWYALTEIDYSELLGHQIMFYYQEPQGKEIRKKLIYAEDDRTEVLKLTPEDIVKFENMTYHYYDEKNRLEKASVKNADIIYNDTAVENYSYDYIPENGDLTLIDRDCDEKYEVIIINDYIDTVCLGTNVTENVVYFNSAVNVDLDDYPNARIINYPNLENFDIEDFRYMHSISLQYGLDGELKKLIAYFSDLNDTVTSKKTVGGENYVEINGEFYKFTTAYYEAVAKGKIDAVDIGSRGRFYLNYRGEIFDWTDYREPYARFSKQWEAAIFDAIAYDGGLSSTIKGRFYTAAKDLEVVEFEDKILIDGKPYTEFEAIRNQMCIDGEEGVLESEPVKQFVRIKFNEKGKLIEIDKVGPEKSDGLWKVTLGTTWDGKQIFGNSSKIVGEHWEAALTGNTAVISCPIDGEDNLVTSDLELMDFQDPRSVVEYSTRFKMDIFRVGTYDPEAVIVHRKDVSVDSGSQLTGVFVVQSVKRKLDANGEDRLFVEVSENGSRSSSYYVDEELLNIKALPLPNGETHTLEIGDVVRLYTRGNYLVKIQIIYDGTKGIGYTTDAEGNTFTSGNHPIYYGHAVSRIKDRILFALGEPGENGAEYAATIDGSLTVVSVYDSEEETFYRGHLEQITDYLTTGDACSRLFIRFDTQNDKGAKAVIIYQ